MLRRWVRHATLALILMLGTSRPAAAAADEQTLTYLLDVRDISEPKVGELGACLAGITEALGRRGFLALAHDVAEAGQLDAAARDFGVPLVLRGAITVWDKGPVMGTSVRSFRASGSLQAADVARGTLILSESKQSASSHTDSRAGLIKTSAKLCSELGAAMACRLAAHFSHSVDGCAAVIAKPLESPAVPTTPRPIVQPPLDHRAECESGSLPACAQCPEAAGCRPAQPTATRPRAAIGDWRQLLFHGAVQAIETDAPLPTRYAHGGALELAVVEQVFPVGALVEGAFTVNAPVGAAVPVQLSLRGESGEVERLRVEHLVRIVPADNGCTNSAHRYCDPVSGPPRRLSSSFRFQRPLAARGTYELRAEAGAYGISSSFVRVVPASLVRAHAAHRGSFFAGAARGAHAAKLLSVVEAKLGASEPPVVLYLAEYASPTGKLDVAVSEPMTAVQRETWARASGAFEARRLGTKGRVVRVAEGSDGVVVTWHSGEGRLIVVAQTGGQDVLWPIASELLRHHAAQSK